MGRPLINDDQFIVKLSKEKKKRFEAYCNNLPDREPHQMKMGYVVREFIDSVLDNNS